MKKYSDQNWLTLEVNETTAKLKFSRQYSNSFGEELPFTIFWIWSKSSNFWARVQLCWKLLRVQEVELRELD